jgi:integrase
MAKVKFTAGRVESFQCLSERSPSFFWDSVMPGLGLRVTPNGAKAYIFQGKLKGQVIRITIGSPAVWDISSAQKESARLRVIIDNGHDRSAWDEYLKAPHPKWGAQHRADHVIASNAGGATPKIGKKETKAAPLASLLSKPLFALTAEVVHEWLLTECATRPTFAHNSFRKFRTFIKWCSKHPEFRELTQSDCCLTEAVRDIVPANKTKEGDSLQREQLAAWFEAVRKLSNPIISAYLQGLLITGARREELAGLCWEHVDFQWRSMTIHDKVEGRRIIPLSPYLSSILTALPRRNKWVFSSPTAANGRLTEPRIAHTRALAAAGLPHVSLHGLRRSFGTLCEWIEMPSGISAQIMGHKPSALAEKHYRRRPIDLLRKWHDQVETWMLEQAVINFPETSL